MQSSVVWSSDLVCLCVWCFVSDHQPERVGRSRGRMEGQSRPQTERGIAPEERLQTVEQGVRESPVRSQQNRQSRSQPPVFRNQGCLVGPNESPSHRHSFVRQKPSQSLTFGYFEPLVTRRGPQKKGRYMGADKWSTKLRGQGFIGSILIQNQVLTRTRK